MNFPVKYPKAHVTNEDSETHRGYQLAQVSSHKWQSLDPVPDGGLQSPPIHFPSYSQGINLKVESPPCRVVIPLHLSVL